MGSSYASLNLHVVFAVKYREPLISPEIQEGLYECVGAIVRGRMGVLDEIGGMPDHVHLLVRWRVDETIASLLRSIKGESSGWVRRHFRERAGHFRWQKGYSVFSVSESVKAKVAAYIQNQEIHHRRQSFEDELKILLQAHGLSPEISSRPE